MKLLGLDHHNANEILEHLPTTMTVHKYNLTISINNFFFFKNNIF